MDERAERWKVIPEYPKYEASNCGRIRHINGSPRKLHKTAGYLYVGLRNEGKYRNLRVHRLVASAFIPNPEGRPCVNHIDGDKTNNYVSNLEWNTASENENHKVHTLGKKQNPPHKTKSVCCVTTGVKYDSIKSASEQTGVNYRHIGEVAQGKRKTAGGYKWEFCL